MMKRASLHCFFSVAGMIEHGLSDCSQYRPRKSLSEDAGLQENNPADDFVSMSASNVSSANAEAVKKVVTGNHRGDAASKTEEPLFPAEDGSQGLELRDSHRHLRPPSRPSPESSESDWETLDPSVLEDPALREREPVGPEQTNSFPKEAAPSDSPPITVQPQANTGQAVLVPGLISGLEEDQYGMPLAVFTKVSLTSLRFPGSAGTFSDLKIFLENRTRNRVCTAVASDGSVRL